MWFRSNGSVRSADHGKYGLSSSQSTHIVQEVSEDWSIFKLLTGVLCRFSEPTRLSEWLYLIHQLAVSVYLPFSPAIVHDLGWPCAVILTRYCKSITRAVNVSWPGLNLECDCSGLLDHGTHWQSLFPIRLILKISSVSRQEWHIPICSLLFDCRTMYVHLPS